MVRNILLKITLEKKDKKPVYFSLNGSKGTHFAAPDLSLHQYTFKNLVGGQSLSIPILLESTTWEG